DQEQDSETVNLRCEFQPSASDVFLLTGGTRSLTYPMFVKSFFCHMRSCQRTQSSRESPFPQTTAKQPGRKMPISFLWFLP
ncbi:Histone-lysine N-methyltransferase PRDM9, partial [Clarias magur]